MQIEERLQTAIRVVQNFLHKAGLCLSANKSKPLLYRPTIGAKKRNFPDIFINTKNSSIIPIIRKDKILDMSWEEEGSNVCTLERVAAKANSMTKLIRRVAN